MHAPRARPVPAVPRPPSELAEPLTRREIQVLVHISYAMTSVEIADALGISPRTVNTHRENIARKLGTSSPAALTRYVIIHQLDLID